MTRILAIDPGPVESAYVVLESDELGRWWPREWAKRPNLILRHDLALMAADTLAVEMVASYGMAVGAEVFETCVWVGRFCERWMTSRVESHWTRILRREVKLHLCGDSRAKDANIRQAIIDRYGGKEQAIGLKRMPGPLYGLTADCWAALGVAITAAETTD